MGTGMSSLRACVRSIDCPDYERDNSFSKSGREVSGVVAKDGGVKPEVQAGERASPFTSPSLLSFGALELVFRRNGAEKPQRAPALQRPNAPFATHYNRKGANIFAHMH